MTTREDHLKKLGFQKPLDESPVTTPGNWSGGSVLNTGGGIYCRLWETDELNGENGRHKYQVIYNVAQDKGVALEKQTYDPQGEYFLHDETIETRKADYYSDTSMAEVALELMEYANKQLITDNEKQNRKSAIITEKIETDTRELKENYGRDLRVHHEFEDSNLPPYLKLFKREGAPPQADEIVSVIEKRGYNLAYIDFEEKSAAFSVENVIDTLEHETYQTIRNLLDSFDIDLQQQSDLEAFHIEDGYIISVTLENQSIDDTQLTDVKEGDLLLRDGIDITLKAIDNDEIFLKVEE